jgi:hypothetical protein
MEPCILTNVKKVLGVSGDYTVFDEDIIMHTNAAFAVLHQLGVGPTGGFHIEDYSNLWLDYDVQGPSLNLVKTYVFLRVRLIFDPPATSYLITAMNAQAEEFEWRLTALKETP